LSYRGVLISIFLYRLLIYKTFLYLVPALKTHTPLYISKQRVFYI